MPPASPDVSFVASTPIWPSTDWPLLPIPKTGRTKEPGMAVKLAAVEQSMSTRVAPKADLPFEEALAAAAATPADESPWERLEAAVVSDEGKARQLLDFYRARLGEALPKPVAGVLSHRAARFASDCFGE